MPVDCDLLFVYGTLRTGSVGSTGRAQRERLQRAATVIGLATIPGRLYNLGQYPGLLHGGPEAIVVRGELLQLSSPHERTLRCLDSYEGIIPDRHPDNEYERRIVEVRLDDGSTAAAWAYLLREQPAHWALIKSGDWLDR